ncbi:MAG TPA: DUF885 family protein, partial [Gemmatimonadales bacterium]|nr:DUF885 family protein [Gemmatimonadales bacterium]
EANARYFRRTLPETTRRFLGDRPFARRALARVTEAGIAAADAYRAFGAFLRSAYDPGDTADRFAAGEEEYEWRVRRCLRVDRSPAELYDYGARQVERYESRVFEVAEAVAREAGLGLRFGTPEQRRTSVRRVLEHLGTDSPADDDELFRWFRETGDRAVRYGREQGLFDVPADYRLDIAPTPPVLRSTIDAAYYPAPPFKRSGVGRFYLTPTGNDPARLALANRASVATLSCHEGFPGHDWHYKFMTEHAAKISNVRWLTMGSVEDSSSMWADSMATEGWALYAEELMAEPVAGRPHGFYHAAEYLYMVQAQLLRAVRVRVDVGIHTGRMSFAEAREYFAEPVAFLPAACARAAAGDAAAKAVCDQADRAIYRYSKWPTQAITYDLGKNEIRELREATVTSPAELRRFHELLLAMGTIPAAHFREGFLSARRPA